MNTEKAKHMRDVIYAQRHLLVEIETNVLKRGEGGLLVINNKI